MIRFIGKFTRDNEIVAWRIEDDGIEYNIAYRATYHEFYFKPMLEAGYKFLDYFGDIKTPDGYKLNDIVESREYLSDTELIDLIDSIEAGILEEKDIVQDLDRDLSITFVDVLEPSNPAILDRDMFVQYIDTLTAASTQNVHRFSTKSVNTIVAKEALFTLEEIISNEMDSYVKFTKLFDSHMMSCLKDISDLKDTYNLTDNMTNNEHILKILKEYYAYGIPGIKANIISVKYDVSPSRSFKDLGGHSNNSSVLKYGLRRDSDYKLFSEDVDNRDYGSLAGDDIADTNAYVGSSSITSIKAIPASYHYSIVPYGFKDTTPRIIIELISADGIRVTFISDCNEAHMYRGSEEILTTLRMFNFKTIDDVYIPYSRIVNNDIQYITDSVLIRAYIAKEIKLSTVKPKFENTFKLMTGIGISPYYAPMYINKMLRNGISSYVEIADVATFTKLHAYCSDTFCDGFSANILSKYGTGEEDFNEKSLAEQLEYINEEISNLEALGKYLVKPEIPDGGLKLHNPEYMDWQDEYYSNEVGNVNFVNTILNGEQNIGQMATGMLLDSGINVYKLFNVIYGAFVAEKHLTPRLKCNEFLSGSIANYIDSSIIFKERKATAVGCLRDIVMYRSDMSNTAKSLLYVTKVFRENSNSEVQSTNRHYGFECKEFYKGPSSKGSQIYRSIHDQIVDRLFTDKLTDQLYIAGDAAALLIFRALNSKDAVPSVDGVCSMHYSTRLYNGSTFEMDVKIGVEYYHALRSGALFATKYSSNYDYCENQFSKADIKADYYCVNASINPWITTPREGFKIPEYNMFVNYFKLEELASNFPTSVLEKISSSKAKCIPCLRESFVNNELFPTMTSVFSREEEMNLAKEGFFLERREYEDLESYINRTTFDIKKAKSEGLAVKNTLLKSDLVYSMFKQYVHFDGVECEQTYYDEYSGPLTNRHVTNMLPRVLTSAWLDDIDMSTLALKSGSNSLSMERVNFYELPYEALEYNTQLLANDFDTKANVCIIKGKLRYLNDLSKSIDELSISDLDELSKLKIAIQVNSNSYLIRTLSGLVRVSV